MGWTPQVDSSGKVHYIDTEGDQGGAWDYLTKHLPRAVSETWGEAITPSLNPVGGAMNAQDYISRHAGLTNQGGESIPEALFKGAAEGALGLAVPKASADLQGVALGAASGGVLQGAGAVRAGDQAASAARGVRDSARAKLKASGSDQYLASRRAGQKVANASDPAGVANPMGKTPYRGPRANQEDITQFERGTGLDRGIPPRENPNLDSARNSARAWSNRTDPVKGHQLKMAKYRMKREQLDAGKKAMKKEQLAEGVKKMKSEQIAEGNQRYVDESAVDKVQQDIAGRYLYDRARNAPVDVEETKRLGQLGAHEEAHGNAQAAFRARQDAPTMPSRQFDPNSARPRYPANEPGHPPPTMDDLAHLLNQDPGMAGRVANGFEGAGELNKFAQSPRLGQLIEQLQQAAPNVDFDTWIALLRKAQMDRGY